MSNFSTDKWVIFLPKQPIKGIWYHKNDSFRELVRNIVQNNKNDVNNKRFSSSKSNKLEFDSMLPEEKIIKDSSTYSDRDDDSSIVNSDNSDRADEN